MTCNPRWTEITNTLNQYFVKGTTTNDIPTIVTDVFQTKVNELINDLVEEQVLGPIVAYVYTIEFQKRGLPHAHILAALRTDMKLLEPEDVNRFITAELSDEDSSLRYYQLQHMMHGPHVDGLLCWDKDKQQCSKKFPREFCDETDMTKEGFPRYRRRNNIDKLYAYHSKVNGKVQYVDNRMVVPHNPYLLKKFDCHINVEYCSSEMAIKYIHKCIHKGHDRAEKTACVAWTGIASILLPHGTTSHCFFNLPIQLNDEGICFLKTRDKLRLQEVDVVIWDEASMIPRKALDIIDRTLRDVMENDLPFGGKTFILGGDFRQVLPVVKKASRSQIIDECIKSSALWHLFEVHHLTINMRAAADARDFADWLLQIGNGDLEELVVDKTSSYHCNDLCTWFFENDADVLQTIILSPQNDEVNRINEKILTKIPEKEVISYSIDYATLSGIDKTDVREEEATLRYAVEYLNSITPSGMPPHKLKLKVGCVVMLIRNLSIADGLCNGTRLVVQKIGCRVMTVQIVTGDRKGTIVDIPRIQLNTSSGHSQLPFILYRRQFPVRLAYALTINKSQGQTFDRVGLYIERPIFGHGQLYVALSRCTSNKNIKVFINNGTLVQNIVYKEILS